MTHNVLSRHQAQGTHEGTKSQNESFYKALNLLFCISRHNMYVADLDRYKVTLSNFKQPENTNFAKFVLFRCKIDDC